MSTPAPQLFQQLKGHFTTDQQQPASDPASQSDQTDVGALAQAVPQVIQDSTDTLNPTYATPSAKEARDASVTLERPAFDQVGGLQQIEHEKNVEISPEVESFISQVGDHPDQLPQEIVIADQAAPVPTTKYLAKPVIILPITPELEKVGAHKKPEFSIRWLVEWSRKMMKSFAGQVIYREATTK